MLQVETRELADALSKCRNIWGGRTPKPILSCVLVQASDTMTIKANNLETSMVVTLTSYDGGLDPVAIPAEKLAEIVKSSESATLSIKVDGGNVIVSDDTGRFKINTYEANDFPAMLDELGDPVTIDGEDLLRALDRTIYATAKENSRYAINGVLLEAIAEKATIVATDGRRLSAVPLASWNGPDATAIIPAALVGIVRGLVGDSVTLSVGHTLTVESDGVKVTGALTEGSFPPYKDVIPKDGGITASMKVDAFRAAVRRAAIMTNEESKGVRFAFNGELKMSSRAPESGEADISVGLVHSTGGTIEIGMDPRFVLDVVKPIDGDSTVTLKMSAPNKPCVISIDNEPGTYVVMPVSLQS